ncbi:MAG: hypothetical protein Kow00114_34300 [Kiloniellaceae bacterium]
MNTLGTVLTSVAAAVVAVAAVTWAPTLFSGADEPAPLASPPRVALDKAGAIYVDSPEIYTRERLVNDRYQQDAWLRRRLELSDSLDFGIQGVRDIRAASQVIMQARFAGTADPLAAAKPALKPDQNAPAPQGQSTAAGDAAANQMPGPRQGAAGENRSPIDDFRDRVAYREEVRNAIIENQLDDRHDLDGNTLYRLKFDATLVPAHNNPHWAKIEVRIKPTVNRLSVEGYAASDPIEARARHLQRQWLDLKPAEALQWQQVFHKYLDGLSQTLHSQLTTRVTALRKIIEREESAANAAMQTKRDLRDLRDRIDEVVKIAFEDLYYYDGSAVAEMSAEMKSHCQGRASETAAVIGVGTAARQSTLSSSYITYLSCMIRGTVDRIGRGRPTGLWSRTQMLDGVISRGLWANFRGATSGGRGSSAAQGRGGLPQIENLGLSDNLQSLVRADPYEFWEPLFDVGDLSADETAALEEDEATGFGRRICKAAQPGIFAEIDRKLGKYGLSLDDPGWRGSPIFRLESPRLELDEASGAISCFVDYIDLRRGDGFITFLERFMSEVGQPAHSYAVTPKEAVQRLSDSFDQAQASSALVAVSLAAAALDAEASAAALKELQKGFAGISRFPLVVGYSQREKPADPAVEPHALTFGWIVGPKFQPGQDGSAPEFRQVLTQQTLSALVSVPAWWPSLDLEVVASWMDMETGSVQEAQRQHYQDVRLPGDFHEIQRILYPVLDKAPKIDRDNMELTIIGPAPANETLAAGVTDTIPVVIPGWNLWRSTVVTLSAQRAQEIWVMPNMEGIIAHFDRAAVLRNAGPGFPLLRVWTSEGMDSVHNKVCVVPPGQTAAQSCQVGAFPLDDVSEAAFLSTADAGAAASRQQSLETAALAEQRALEQAMPQQQAMPPGGVEMPQAAADALPKAAVVEKLVQTLAGEAAYAGPLMARLSEDPGADPGALDGSVKAIGKAAQELAALEKTNDTAQAIAARARAIEQTLALLVDAAGTAEKRQHVQALDQQMSALTANLQVLDLQARREALDRAVAGVSVSAHGEIGAAAIQQAGAVRILSLRILGLAELAGRPLDLRLGLVPAAQYGDVPASYFTTPIENWRDRLRGGVLELEDIVLPLPTAIENGAFVTVALQADDRDLSHAAVARSGNLVFYSDAERASIRAVGREIRLDPEGMEGLFSVTLPARTIHAFPFSSSNWIVAKAAIQSQGETIDLRPEFFPVTDFDEEDMGLNKELTLTMALDLSGSDKELLQSHIAQYGPIPVELSFHLDQPGEIPEIRNDLFIVGFEEPRS